MRRLKGPLFWEQQAMTLDRTLKRHGGLAGSRSVLTRAERIRQMIDEDKFDPEKDSPLGLPKVRVRHSKAGTKAKKEEVEEAPPAETPEAADESKAGKS